MTDYFTPCTCAWGNNYGARYSNIERATYGLYSFINAAKPTRIIVIDEDEVDPPISLTTTESRLSMKQYVLLAVY